MPRPIPPPEPAARAAAASRAGAGHQAQARGLRAGQGALERLGRLLRGGGRISESRASAAGSGPAPWGLSGLAGPGTRRSPARRSRPVIRRPPARGLLRSARLSTGSISPCRAVGGSCSRSRQCHVQDRERCHNEQDRVDQSRAPQRPGIGQGRLAQVEVRPDPERDLRHRRPFPGKTRARPRRTLKVKRKPSIGSRVGMGWSMHGLRIDELEWRIGQGPRPGRTARAGPPATQVLPGQYRGGRQPQHAGPSPRPAGDQASRPRPLMPGRAGLAPTAQSAEAAPGSAARHVLRRSPAAGLPRSAGPAAAGRPPRSESSSGTCR